MNEMSTRIEDEQALVNQLQKKIKELQVQTSLLISSRTVMKHDFDKIKIYLYFPPGPYRGAGGGAGGRPGL